MGRLKIFISSVQNEFAKERAELASYLRHDPLPGTFFEPFIFEEFPANTLSPGKVYLAEVKDSDIYIGLLGASYGFEDEMGVSPTEREYDQAKAEHIPRWIFIKETVGADRHPKEIDLIRKIEQDVSRKKFSTFDSERFGTGILEMYNLIRERGLKPPLISLDEGFKLTIWRPSAETVHDTVHDTIHETVHDISSTFTEIAELTHRLVLVIQGEMSRVQLMEILELKNRSHFSISYLEPALKEELIEMTLPEKSKSKNQKYRLTSKGLVLKENLEGKK